jgi:hypothetical protein
VEGDEKVAVSREKVCHTRSIQQLRQGVAQPLGLLFLDTLDTPSYTNAILQLALQGVAAQVNGSLKSAGVM